MRIVLVMVLRLALPIASNALSFLPSSSSSLSLSSSCFRRSPYTIISYCYSSSTTLTNSNTKLRVSQQRRYGRSAITMMPEGPEVRTVVDQLQGGVNMRLVAFHWISGRYVRNGPPETYKEFMDTMTMTTTMTMATPTNSRTTTTTSSATTNSSTNSTNTCSAQILQHCDIIQQWSAKGKFIYLILDRGGLQRSTPQDCNSDAADDFQRSIWITLAMTGRFVAEANHQQDSTHARWYMTLLDPATGTTTNIYYHDQRNFGTIKFCTSRTELTEKLQSLGPDILDPNTTPRDLLSIVSAQKNQKTNVCKFLMNQAKVSGVGNYILAEGLYRANIDPFASLNELGEHQWRLLFQELQQTAVESYRSQGMTRAGGSYRDVQGNRGTYVFHLQVYGRKICPKGDPVHQEVDGPHGRTIWYTERQLFMPRKMRNGVKDSEDLLPTLTTPLVSPTTTGLDTVSISDTKSAPTRDALVLQQQPCLTSSLTDDGWKRVLSDCMTSQSFQQLSDFLKDEQRNGITIYPPEEDIFSALNLCPFDKVKVVIVGQDPYHGKGQGHGLAFSVRPGVRIPPSLLNVFREAKDDVGIDTPKSGYLKCWAEQGVLLLNAVLTVREGEANSHAKKGWEVFTSVIIETLNREKDGLVFLLWGTPAAKMANNVDASKHTIIHSSHPSPLGATKTARPFLGSRCFSRANEAIARTGKDPIDWNVR